MISLFAGDDVLVAYSAVPQATTVVVTFSNHTAQGQLDYFGRGYLERRGFSVLYIVARRNMWWQTVEMTAALAAAIQALSKGPNDIVVYGASMGGYGSLLYAAALNARRVIVASPQVSLADTAILRPEWVESIKLQPIIFDSISDVLQRCRVDMIFDPADPLDGAHATLLAGICKRNGVALRRYLIPFAGHLSLGYLHRIDLLSGLVDKMILGQLDVPYFRGLIRRTRREALSYFERGAILLKQRGKPGWSEAFVHVASNMRLTGYIEQFVPGRHVHAYVRASGPMDRATAIARLHGEIILQAEISLTSIQGADHRRVFVIELDRHLTVTDMLDGFTLELRLEDGTQVTLGMNTMLRAALQYARGAALLDTALSAVPTKGTTDLMRRVALYIGREQRSRLAPTLVSRFNSSLPPTQDFSPVLLPAGLRSPDGVALVGRGGYFYVVGGSTNFELLFAPNADIAQMDDLKARWVSLIERRRSALARARACLIQVIVPEKITALPNFYPGDIHTPSHLLESIDSALRHHPDLGCQYVSGLSLVRKSDATTLYRRIDSHLTPRGAYAFAAEILRAAGFPPPAPVSFDANTVRAGDLGDKFFGYPLREEFSIAGTLPEGAHGRKLIEQFTPDDGGHIGRRIVISNQRAPIARSMIVFGNSFMDYTHEQYSMSFWLSCWFRDFHFVFSPHIDMEYVASVKDPIVVAQTIERYLIKVPES